MGVRLWRSFFVPLWVFFIVIALVSADTICDVHGCNCTKKAAQWKTVNCTLNDVQDLKLEPPFIPNEVVELFIVGGKTIILGPKSFDGLPNLNLLRIEGTHKFVMERQSLRNLTSASLLIQIQNCDHLTIKTGAFEYVQSSIEVEIVRCASVNIEKSAFNKLKSAIFKDIPKLTLATRTFEFKHQGSIGRHGPVTIISFDNVTIPAIPHQTFFSNLAEIKIQHTHIKNVQTEAFSAYQISAVSIYNSKIDTLPCGAFLDKILIYNFKISNCTISKIETGAIMAAIGNLTVQHSRITDIQSGAINSTVSKADISGNEIANFHSYGFVFHQSWNKIYFEQNIIKFLHSHFMVAPASSDVLLFTYKGNDVFNFEPGALSFVPDLEDNVFVFKNNFFNQTCHCTIEEWVAELITANVTSKIKKIINNTFCTVNDLLSQCFELPVGIINIQNFTELVCNTNNTIICEPYRGETKIVNTTSKMLSDNIPPEKTNWLTLIITITALVGLSVIATFIIMLIRGSRWLKRKGYFRKIQYNQNEHSNDEENTIETVDESDKFDISEDLTMEMLQDLSKKLDDPNTHQEASEIIEQLYQKYIRNNGVEHNEEAHLYEELGNLQSTANNEDLNKAQNGPRSILRLMEEKFNTQFEEIDAENNRPPLIGEYSEPSDAAVHLYSELKQNKDSESENRDSLKSRGSSSMAFRPLPDKPGSSKM